MKAEPRGKYAGVKLHLEPDEVAELLTLLPKTNVAINYPVVWSMAKTLEKVSKKHPELLEERTPEQIAAIMAKEIEKQTLQLAQLKAGLDWKKVDPNALKAALLAHVKEE